MPKLPHISGLAIVKALERLGFEKLRQSGSHVSWGAMEKAVLFPTGTVLLRGALLGDSGMSID